MLQATCWYLRAATWLRTWGMQATRLLTDKRMLAAGGGWYRSGPLRSFPPEPEVPFFTLADRIFWQGIKDERPFRPGRQCLEVVELTFGSANVCTLLPAERSAASRAGPPAVSGRRVDLADQLHQGGDFHRGYSGDAMQRASYRFVSRLWGVRRSCRQSGSVVLSCGYGKTSWEIPGHFTCWSQSLVFSWSRATPRLGSSSSVCVMGLTSRATKLKFSVVASFRRTHPERMSGLFTARGAGMRSVASLAVGDQAADWEDTAGAEFHALLLEWDLCLPATLPGPHNDPAKPSGTWCSRTRWHRIDFVAVPRDWLAGVKNGQRSRRLWRFF